MTAPTGGPGSGAPDELAALFDDVAEGRYPEPDFGFSIVAPDRTTGQHVVLGFSGHAVIATDRRAEDLAALGADGIGGAEHPDVLRHLAGPHGWIGVLDAMLVARGTGRGGTTLAATTEHDDHRRAVYARSTRVDVMVLADHRGLITLGRGLGGRAEIGIQVVDDAPPGTGRSLLRDLLDEVPEGQPIWASCAPGNARSLRALLAAGFVVVGSEVLMQPAEEPAAP